MEISCIHCKTRVNVPDQKIPKGRKASLVCPKCRQKIHIIPGEDGSYTPIDGKGEKQAKVSSKSPSKVPSQTYQPPTPAYSASNKPFEVLDENSKTALLCISHPHALELAGKIMNSMQYHTESVDNVEKALTYMKFHLFNIIILDEDFDTNRRGSSHIIDFLNELEMMSRRKVIVFLLSRTQSTMDNMASFNFSVNQIMNLGKLNGMEGLLKRTIKEHDQFYSVFNDSLKKIGKAT
ncbi:MAG: zinc-ribbon domain-containing protein [Desulfamplus sp.]|nr:zinc-ribbon domain-containing protein [Desulfamplus sp.]